MAISHASFDVWLRTMIAHRNLSGATVARRLALPPETVYSWLYGLRAPEESVYADLSEVLGLTISELRRALSPARTAD